MGFIGSVIPGRLLLSRAYFRFTENAILPGHVQMATGVKPKKLAAKDGGLPTMKKSDKLPTARYNSAPPCATIFDCRAH